MSKQKENGSNVRGVRPFFSLHSFWSWHRDREAATPRGRRLQKVKIRTGFMSFLLKECQPWETPQAQRPGVNYSLRTTNSSEWLAGVKISQRVKCKSDAAGKLGLVWNYCQFLSMNYQNFAVVSQRYVTVLPRLLKYFKILCNNLFIMWMKSLWRWDLTEQLTNQARVNDKLPPHRQSVQLSTKLAMPSIGEK